MIEERSSAGLVIERPAERMLDQARMMFIGLDLPDFLEANAVFLRFAFLAKPEAMLQHFRERTARALADQRVFGVDFDARCKHARFRLAFAVNAHVAGL